MISNGRAPTSRNAGRSEASTTSWCANVQPGDADPGPLGTTGGCASRSPGSAIANFAPKTLPEALRLAADLAEQKDKAEAALAIAGPKAAALDQIAAGTDAVTFTQTAKLLGIKRSELTVWLHANGWVYRQNGAWVAYDQHIKNGRLQFKEARYTDEKTGQECHAPYCHVLPKGLAVLAKHFAGSGAIA